LYHAATWSESWGHRAFELGWLNRPFRPARNRTGDPRPDGLGYENRPFRPVAPFGPKGRFLKPRPKAWEGKGWTALPAWRAGSTGNRGPAAH